MFDFLREWEVNRLLVLFVGLIALLALFLNSNVKFKIGDKELILGGGAKRLDDITQKENLSNEINNVDIRRNTKLYQAAKSVKHSVQALLADHHCPFTMYTAGDFLEDCLQNSVRTDFVLNAKEGESILKLSQNLLNEYEKVYGQTIRDAANAPCHDDTFPSWEKIKDNIGKLLENTITDMYQTVIECAEKKLAIYKEYEHKFNNKAFVKQSVTPFVAKNEGYIATIKKQIDLEKSKAG